MNTKFFEYISKKMIFIDIGLLLLTTSIFTVFFWKSESLLTFLGSRSKPPLVNMREFRMLPDKERLKILREIGSEEGYEAVRAFLKGAYPDEPSDAHELFHVVGEAAFSRLGYSGFGVCDSASSFACYHGVILEAIKKNGYTDKVLKNAAQGCLSLGRNKTATTACIHGIGHAMMWVKSYDLMETYKTCDQMFHDEADLFFCYDGASMENVVRRGDQERAVDQLKSDDPYYPCNAIPSRYQPACVREHLHHARRVFYDKDTERVKTYCLYFKEEKVRIECFGALGNAISQDNFDDPLVTISECKKIGPLYHQFCIGVAATQYSFARQFENAQMLCEALPAGEQRENCMGSIRYAQSTLF